MKCVAAIFLPLLLFCARSASSESPRSASSTSLQVATATDFVPTGGAFTATALLRVDGYAPIPERMAWRNGMALCCGSGYYDGFRLLFHDESEFRPVFEIGRPQGAVALEASSGISTGVWHHVAISWEPAAPSVTNGTARLWVDGQLAAVSAPNFPAPILRGEPLKTGYVDFGVGALNGEVAAVSLEPRSLSQSKVVAVFWYMASKLPSAPPVLLRESVLALRPPSAPPPEATDASALLESVTNAIPGVKSRAELLAPARQREGAIELRRPAPSKIRQLSPGECGDDAARAIEAALAELGPGANLFLEPGTYPICRTIEIRGDAARRIRISGQGAVLDGSVAVSRAAFAPLADKALLARLPTEAARRAVVAAPAPAGLIAPAPCGVGVPGPRRGVLLFADGTNELALARWPNEGWAEAVADPATGCFTLTNAPALSVGTEALAQGWWRYDWADATLPVRVGTDGAFSLLTPHCHGLAEKPRVALLGAPEFLSRPGEWCLVDGLLLLWPPEGGFAEVRVPVMAEPLLRIDGAEDVVIEGLSLRGTAGDALRAHAAANLVLRDIDVFGVGGIGADLGECERAFVLRCRFERTGHGGLRLAAGSRAPGSAPRSGGAIVHKCAFTHTARLALCYAQAILLEGCGALVAESSFEGLPSSAIRIEGNDHVVAGCRFRHCVEESDDQGAIDIWGDPTYLGNKIAFNLFEDVGAEGTAACGRAAVRLDDLIGGTDIYGNLFRRASRGNFGAVQVHGGRHNRIFANVCEDCAIAVSFDSWEEGRRRDKLGEPEFREKCAGRADNPAWLERYPELAFLRVGPDVNLVVGNLFVRCGRHFRRKKAFVTDFWNREGDSELALQAQNRGLAPTDNQRKNHD